MEKISFPVRPRGIVLPFRAHGEEFSANGFCFFALLPTKETSGFYCG